MKTASYLQINFVNELTMDSSQLDYEASFHTRIHKATWQSPDNTAEHNIDHCYVAHKFRIHCSMMSGSGEEGTLAATTICW